MFDTKEFSSAAGLNLSWKIECDDLTHADLTTLAKVASSIIMPYGVAVGVPTGGALFAACMDRFSDPSSDRMLICDDVLTTGKSITQFRQSLVGAEPDDTMGLVIFNRTGIQIPWIHSIFTFSL